MKSRFSRSLLLAAGGAIFLTGGCTRTPTGPATVESPDHAFHFGLPSGATPAVARTDLLNDPANSQTVDLTSHTDYGSFAVRRMRIADAVWEKETAKEMLDEARDNLLRLPTASLDHEEDLQVQGNSGRSLRLHDGPTASQQQFSRMDFIVAKPSLYVLTFASAHAEAVDRPEVQQFFNSLVLVPAHAN
jgi:hypothetical protein